MFVAVIVLHTLLCFAIIGIVLLQSGKGADIGSAFGGAGSQAVFGSMGTPTVLSKITSLVAVLFLVTSFGLALMGSERGTSVIREAPGAAPTAPSSSGPAVPATPPATPATPPAATSPAPSAPAK